MDISDDWGLGWIQEELKQLDFSGLGCEVMDDMCVNSADIETTPTRSEVPLAPKEFRDEYEGVIYATVNVSPNAQYSKDATRFITEKYDTLGRVEVSKPQACQVVNTLQKKNIQCDVSSTAVQLDDVWISSSTSSPVIPVYDPSKIPTSQLYESTREQLQTSRYSPVKADYSKSFGLNEGIRVSSPLPPTVARKLTYENKNSQRLSANANSYFDSGTMSTLSRKYMAGCRLVPDDENESMDKNKSAFSPDYELTVSENRSAFMLNNGDGWSTESTPTFKNFSGQSSGVEFSISESSGQTSDTHLTEQEILQVEMFYRSHNTDVFVCKCSADLMLGRPCSSSNRVSTALSAQNNRLSIVSNRPTTAAVTDTVVDMDNWTLVKSGIPVVVMDVGDGRRQRRLHIVLAERGTGFTLWRDVVDYLTDYSAVSVNFHTMHLSSDHMRLVGLRFDKSIFAGEFAQRIHKLTINPADSLFNLAGSKKSKKVKKPKTKFKRPSKADISLPCCMTHITKLDALDGETILRGDSN